MNMRGLHDFTALEHVSHLEEFALIEAMGNDPSELEPVMRNPKLRRVQAGFGSIRKNRLFEQMRDEASLGPFNYGTPFEYGRRGA
jgi:hypothetical protein